MFARRGFTLVELLVVIAIMMILIGLLMPALSAARYSARKGKARSEVKQIETAWKAFYDDYRFLPTAHEMDGPACSLLRGDAAANARNICYLEIGDDEIDEGGLLDPWDNTYKLALDSTGNNLVVVPHKTDPLYRSVAVWSVGRDGEEGTEDDITSWKQKN